MKLKLFYLGCSFVFMWTLGEVFQAPYDQKLTQALSMTLAYAIYLGVYSVVWSQLKAVLGKIFHIN